MARYEVTDEHYLSGETLDEPTLGLVGVARGVGHYALLGSDYKNAVLAMFGV